MYDNKFSEGLQNLMTDLHLSGRKLGEELGLSQRTVSRYATGTVVPCEGRKVKILEAVSKLRVMDDRAAKVYAELRNTILSENIHSGIEGNRQESLISIARKYSEMSEEVKEYFLNNLTTFIEVTEYEIEILKLLNRNSEEYRNSTIKELKIFNMELDSILRDPSTCCKINKYVDMIGKSSKVKNTYTLEQESLSHLLTPRRYLDVIEANLEEYDSIEVLQLDKYMRELTTISKEGWYLLMLLQLLALRDTGYNVTAKGEVVGDKVNSLLAQLRVLDYS